MASKAAKKSFSGAERRRAARRPIVSTFSFFLVVPKKGGHRLPIQDISELGIGFELDIEGEEFKDFPLKQGESIDVQFFLNQSLYLPLSVRIVRLIEAGHIRRIGAEFVDDKAPEKDALGQFLKALDAITACVKPE